MPKDMAMNVPDAGIVGVEGNRDARPGWHKDGVAESPLKRFAVDLDHLKRVPVQVHGVRHAGLIDELERDSLTALDPHLGFLAAGMCGVKDNAVDGPRVAGHIALQAQIETLVNRLRSERRRRDQLALRVQSQQSRGGRILRLQLLDWSTPRRQDEPGLLRRALS